MVLRVDAAVRLYVFSDAVFLPSVVSQFSLLFFAACRCIVAELLLWLGVVAPAMLNSVAKLYFALILFFKNKRTAAAVSFGTLTFFVPHRPCGASFDFCFNCRI